MRKQVSAILAPLFLGLVGCLSAPLPEDLVPGGPPPPAERLTAKEVSRLSRAGVSPEVIAELLRSQESTRPARRERIVYRELVVPLWPSYSGGRWRLGLRIGCFVRRPVEDPDLEILEPEPEPPPLLVDP